MKGTGVLSLAQPLRFIADALGEQVVGLRKAVVGHLSSVAESNARLLCLEIAFAGVLTAAASFNAAFAIRLGASNGQVGLLSSIPALLAVLVTIPAGRILGRRAQRMPLVLWAIFLHRLTFLLVALVPFVPHVPHGPLVVALLIAGTPPAHFFAVGWNSMLADVVPEAQRARLFAIRSTLAAVTVTVGIYLAGLWLDRVRLPLNYQVVYLVGFAASMVSLYFMTKLQVPDSYVPPAQQAQRMGVRVAIQGARDALAHHPDFVRMTVNTLMHGIGLWMVAPLYMLYYVRQLQATDGWIGLNGTLANLTPILGYYLWTRLINRRGENLVLKATIVCMGLYPLAVGLVPGLSAILVCTALYGIVVAGVNVSHFPMLLKVCPAEQRPLYLGIFTTIMNSAAFIAPLVGVALANVFGFAPILVLGGALSVLGSSSFIWHPLQTEDSLAARRAAAGP